jgi:hypothetical protein
MMKSVLLKDKGLSLVFAVLLLVFCRIPLTVCVAESAQLSLEEQEQLARQIYTIMSKTDESETDTFIKLHRQVIDRCPDTERAIDLMEVVQSLFAGEGSTG